MVEAAAAAAAAAAACNVRFFMERSNGDSWGLVPSLSREPLRGGWFTTEDDEEQVVEVVTLVSSHLGTTSESEWLRPRKVSLDDDDGVRYLLCIYCSNMLYVPHILL